MTRAKNDKERKKIVDRIETAYQETEGMTIKEACDAYGISDCTSYTWRKRLDKQSLTSEYNTDNKTNTNIDNDSLTDLV